MRKFSIVAVTHYKVGFLVFRYSPDEAAYPALWVFPGGKVESEETITQAWWRRRPDSSLEKRSVS